MADNGDEEQLAIAVIAKLTDLEKQMAKANGITARAYREMSLNSRKATRQMEQDAKRSATRINQAMAQVGTRIGAYGKAFATGFVSAAALRNARDLIDTATRIENALKVAGLEGAELTQVYDALLASAQKNAAPIESLTTLYSRLALTQKELNVSQAELLNFTDKISLALRVGGTDAQSASGALLQLSQALGGGIVRAEEFNSMLEGTPTIVQAVAAGLKEAGGSVSALRTLVVDGKVSSESFFRAFEAGAVTLEDKVASAEMTVSQQFVRLQNVLIDTAGRIDEATGVSNGLGGALEDLAEIVQSFGSVVVSVAESDIGTFIGKIVEAYGEVRTLIKFMGGLPGVFKKMSQLQVDLFNGLEPGTTMRADSIQARIDQAFEGTGVSPKSGRVQASAPATVTATVKPVSLDDYAVPASSTGRAQGGGRSASARAAAREREAVSDLISSLEEELRIVGASDQQKRAASILRQAGAAATEEERQKIVALNEALYQEEAAREAAQDALNAQKDALNGFISDLRNGASVGDAFANVLSKIADRMQTQLVDALFSVGEAGKGIGSGGGLFGSLFSGVFSLFSAQGNAFGAGGVHAFAKGGTFTNKVVDSPTMFRFANGTGLMGEAGPEAIVPLSRDASGRLGVTMNGGGQSGGTQSVKVQNEIVVTVENDKFKAYVTKVSQTEAAKAGRVAVAQANKSAPAAVAQYQQAKAGGDYRNQ